MLYNISKVSFKSRNPFRTVTFPAIEQVASLYMLYLGKVVTIQEIEKDSSERNNLWKLLKLLPTIHYQNIELDLK